jgi:hypothetical protein
MGTAGIESLSIQFSHMGAHASCWLLILFRFAQSDVSPTGTDSLQPDFFMIFVFSVLEPRNCSSLQKMTAGGGSAGSCHVACSLLGVLIPLTPSLITGFSPGIFMW